MGITNDYFLLYHGVNFKPRDETSSIEIQDKDLLLYAMLLAVTRKKFEKFILLPSFTLLCKQLSLPVFRKLEQLHQIQYTIAKYIQDSKRDDQIDLLHETFLELLNEGVLYPENYKKLISLFEYHGSESKETSQTKKDFTFQEAKEKLLSSIKAIRKEIDDTEFLQELDAAAQYLKDQKFSIGITGVMNAGKSTMINALMGKDILGSSVVPETANLTLLKYSEKEHARVFYWNRQEWERVVSSAEQLDSMKEFVAETEQTFGTSLKNYICNESRVDEVSVEKLSDYTSAKYSNKRCNLIKYVELRTDLSFLQDGVEIVDTPGLDDPVIQREEITKEYISRCDMMFHLMNVSQSATKKDVEFIIDALLYQNISKLLVIITRADTVEKQELEEVIAYTKRSIEEELKLQNKGSKLNYILDTIAFIPISGKMALEYRLNESKAKAEGISLEESGILSVEHYLQENLFGTSSKKSELIIRSSQNQLMALIAKIREYFEYVLEMSSKSKEELEEKLQQFHREKANEEKLLSQIREDLVYYRGHLEQDMRSLENFLNSEFYDLQTIIQQRVVSDVRYSYEKTKKIPKASRTTVIVQTAIKDGIIDIVRDYKYKLGRKFEEISEQCYEKYTNLNLHTSLDDGLVPFDANAFFGECFQAGFLTQNNDLFIKQILESIEKSKANDIHLLDHSIQEIVKENLQPIEAEIKRKVNTLTVDLIEKLMKKLKQPMAVKEQQIKRDEESLTQYLRTFEKNEEQGTDSAIEIHEKMKRLKQIEQTVMGFDNE